MKIEMGESLIYSWLRHEKQCQLAQTNWKSSQYWGLDNIDELQILLTKFSEHYKGKSHGKVFLDDGYNITIWKAVYEVLAKHHKQFII